jgi:hypothetical protein
MTRVTTLTEMEVCIIEHVKCWALINMLTTGVLFAMLACVLQLLLKFDTILFCIALVVH